MTSSNKKFWPNNYLLMYFLIILMILINTLALMTTNLNQLWILLETNFMIFMFMMIQLNKFNSLIPMFFIIQSLSSLMIIWMFNFYSSMFILYFFDFWFYLAMMIKIGLFPFTWLPLMIYKNLNWWMIFSLSTLQKFIPMIMINLYTIEKINFWIFFTCMISMIISSMKTLFYNNLKSIMALSSINNSCWMILIILTNFYAFLFFFLFYSLVMFFLTNLFTKIQINSLNQLMIINMFTNKINLINFLFLNLFTLSMIPPMISFSLKLNILTNITSNNLSLLSFWIMIWSSLSIFMYMNIMIKTLYFSFIKFKWNKKIFKLFYLPIFSMVSSLAIFFMNFMINI